jgi:hypothetical protein
LISAAVRRRVSILLGGVLFFAKDSYSRGAHNFARNTAVADAGRL